MADCIAAACTLPEAYPQSNDLNGPLSPLAPVYIWAQSLVRNPPCQQQCAVLQAIKDAEADERIADQLAALQLTLSQLADQEEGDNTAEAVTDAGDTTVASPHSQVLSIHVTAHHVTVQWFQTSVQSSCSMFLALCARTTDNVLTAVVGGISPPGGFI